MSVFRAFHLLMIPLLFGTFSARSLVGAAEIDTLELGSIFTDDLRRSAASGS